MVFGVWPTSRKGREKWGTQVKPEASVATEALPGPQVLHILCRERCRIFVRLLVGTNQGLIGVAMRTQPNFAAQWVAGIGIVTGVLCAACFGAVDQPKPVSTSSSTSKTRRKAVKKPPLPPLPSGPRGPVPQISLDSMQAVAPHVTYEGGQLTIVAPNSTLADILRAVRRLTGADVDIPSNATERVVTNLGPGPAPGVVAELLNGSHFNYVLLGAPSDAKTLTRVVLVAKSGPETTAPGAGVVANAGSPQPVVAQGAPDAADADTADDADDSAEQNAAEAAEPQPAPGGDNAVKTPQQLLQEMQQRQLQMQQQQQAGGALQPGQPPTPGVGITPPQRGPQQQPPLAPQQPPDQ